MSCWSNHYLKTENVKTCNEALKSFSVHQEPPQCFDVMLLSFCMLILNINVTLMGQIYFDVFAVFQQLWNCTIFSPIILIYWRHLKTSLIPRASPRRFDWIKIYKHCNLSVAYSHITIDIHVFLYSFLTFLYDRSFNGAVLNVLECFKLISSNSWC